MKMSGAQAILEVLKREGVRHLFGVPGENFTPLMDALYDEPSIEFIVGRQEGGAAFMAEAYAGSGGGVGVVLGARAVGATNLSIGVHTAMENSTPMVVLLGQLDSKFRGREGFQEIDLDRMFAPLCKWAMELSDARRLPEILQRAFRLARSGRPGPVVVSLTEDALHDELEANFSTPLAVSRPRPSPDEVSALVRLLAQARRPVIVAGAGVKRAGAESLLVQFAERCAIPVMAAWRRHDVFPNGHPLYCGHLQMGTHPALVDTLRQADMLIVIGARLNEITTQNYTAVNAGQRILQIDIDDRILGKAYPIEHGVVADARQALEALLEQRFAAPSPDWAKSRRAIYEDVTGLIVEPHDDYVDNRQIIRELRAQLPDDAILTNDAGNFAGWMHTFFIFRQSNTYVGAASGAMGYGMPAAIGVQLAQPSRTVVSLSGDGGLMMTIQELETAVRLKLPVIALVFNNNMYGSIRMHQEKAHPGRVIGSDLGNPDFVLLAQAFGAQGLRVSNDAAFAQALQIALQSTGPVLIEIVCDPQRISVRQTIEQIRQSGTGQ
ncbi:thiamine pyrophosphate-dependent enzyme [Pseudomonas coleopterorum]|uniref:Thiamine pyrophosphate-binding protein n=1 Tax=Pseudomonas coleopterorum TaxID=1605838 RepID=A0AAJ6M2Y1_9PSED|nr:thiamine pyrophosphate-dependent enzyme [Pseudomonas coleopterorum]WNC11150.1 thiamine pyrophosphate-binding protein [Pseudomonas coleopterorum]